MTNRTVKEQFNKQAEKFANWSVGRNVEYLNAYFNFCDIKESDKLLDVACGPGEFTIFNAKRILEARGADISDKEIEIAKNLAKEFGLNNIGFDCCDVEHLPYNNDTFSVVVCKSAFHHFTNPNSVFKEMIRCCKKGGLVSIQDIRAYDNDYINNYFETLDKFIDVSHNKALTETEFNKLFSDNAITKTGEFKLEVDLSVDEYINHAVQSDANKLAIDKLLKNGLEDKRLNDYLFERDDDLFFKRPVYVIKGIK